jgi:hypothetical protein
MSYMTGVRPGTLGLSRGYEKTKQALFWKDITFIRFEDKPGVYLQIHYKWLKGQRDPHHEKSAGFSGAQFLLLPCREAENLVVDLTWLLLRLAMDRGLFGDSRTEDLLNHASSRLPHDEAITEQPVFVALKGPNNVELDCNKPILANNFNPPLQRSSYLAGLAARVTMYCFRREFITTMGRNLNVQEAKTLATHRSEQLGAYGMYLVNLSIQRIIANSS